MVAAGDSTVENVIGTDAVDNITGDNQDNFLSGGDGNDTISALGGVDLIEGNGGNDSIFGGIGDDHLVGGAGQDMLSGGSGTDSFYFLGDEGFSTAATVDAHFDTLSGYSAPSGEKLVIDGSTADFGNLAGVGVGGDELDPNGFVLADIDTAMGPSQYLYAGFVVGEATFVLDTVTGGGENVSLWYDNNGDGEVDFKVAEFNVTSNLSGFDADDFTII